MEEVVDHLLIANKSQNHKYDTKIDPPHIFKPQTFEKSDFEAVSKLCLPNSIDELTYRKPIEENWSVPIDFRSSLSTRHSFVSVPCSGSVEDGNCTYHSNDAYSVARYLNRNNGFYLEVGGFDGLDNSQTRFVESLGWSGVVIEADPDNYIKLVNNRPSATTVNAIVCKDEKTDFHFVRNEDHPHVNGIWEHMTIGFREMWYPNLNISENVGDVIKCKPLSDILQSLCIWHVDYFRINVCGGELSVLQSVIWLQLTVNIISVEVVRAGQTDYMLLERVGNFLEDRGFLYEGILENNAMFIHKRIKKAG